MARVTAEAIRARRAVTEAALGRRLPVRRKSPRAQEPRSPRARYTAALLGVVREVRSVVEDVLVPALPRITAAAQRARGDTRDARADAVDEEIDAVIGNLRIEFARRVPRQRIRDLAEETGEAVDAFSRGDFNRQLRSVLGIDLAQGPVTRPMLDMFVRENVTLIDGMTSTLLQQIEATVNRGASQGLRHEEIARQIQERLDVGESRAALIARDQVSKLNGQLTQARQTAVGAKSYVWRSSRDERVRPEHRELDGQKFEWSDPPDEGHPGQAINCRCVAELAVDDLLQDLGL